MDKPFSLTADVFYGLEMYVFYGLEMYVFYGPYNKLLTRVGKLGNF